MDPSLGEPPGSICEVLRVQLCSHLIFSVYAFSVCARLSPIVLVGKSLGGAYTWMRCARGDARILEFCQQIKRMRGGFMCQRIAL